MRALVVDDSRTMRRIVKSLIVGMGYSAEEAENGKEALEVLAQIGPVELALVDWNMPVMSGIDFVKAARALPAYAEMRIMLVTSETDMTRVIEALESGANEYLMKPLTPDALREKLQIMGLPCS